MIKNILSNGLPWLATGTNTSALKGLIGSRGFEAARWAWKPLLASNRW